MILGLDFQNAIGNFTIIHYNVVNSIQIGIKSIKNYFIALLCKKKVITKNSQVSHKSLIFLVKLEIYITGLEIPTGGIK